MTEAGRAVPADPGSPQTTSRVRRKALLFPTVVLLLVVVLGALRLSGSSLGVYATAHGADEDDAGVLAGPVRHIRSDEWAVRTPWVLRQVELGFPTRAVGGMGEHDVTVIADLPVRSWEVALRPHMASYLVIDEEVAFALEWWLLAAVQLLGVYTLLYALTQRPAVSALCASLLTLSPATQWWWVPGAFNTIGYGCLATGLVVFAYRAADQRRRIAWSVGAGWAFAAFLATLYPPWQIGTALVVGPVGVAALGPDVFRSATRRRALASLAVVAVVVVGLAALMFGSFVIAHQDTISTIADTEYPGAQPSHVGGNASLPVLWGAAFDYFSARQSITQVNGTNQSENSSGLVFLLPVGLAVFGLACAGRLRDHAIVRPLFASLAAGAVLLGWMLLPVPETLGRLVLLTRAQPGRLFLPVTFAGVVALALLIAYLLDTGQRLGALITFVSIGAFAAALAWGAGAYRVDTHPIDLSVALSFIVLLAGGLALAFSGRPIIGLGILATFVFWQATLINPVQRGLAPITDSPLRRAIDELRDAAPERASWIAFNADVTVKGTLTASGVNHVTGDSPYPDWRAWRILDPELRNKSIWNRYAHLGFIPGPAGSPVRFEITWPDSFNVTLDPCSGAVASLDVGFFVVQNAEFTPPCASLLREVPVGAGSVAIYRRMPPK